MIDIIDQPLSQPLLVTLARPAPGGLIKHFVIPSSLEEMLNFVNSSFFWLLVFFFFFDNLPICCHLLLKEPWTRRMDNLGHFWLLVNVQLLVILDQNSVGGGSYKVDGNCIGFFFLILFFIEILYRHYLW